MDSYRTGARRGCSAIRPTGAESLTGCTKEEDARRKGATVVMLVPAQTDTKWLHDVAFKHEVRYLQGRLKFGGSWNPAPFPCIVVVFRPRDVCAAVAARAA